MKPNVIEKVYIAEIDNEVKVLSDKIKSGDNVIGFIEKPVNSYWIKDAVVGNVLNDGSMLVFKNGMSCGRTNKEKWFKIIGVLNTV